MKIFIVLMFIFIASSCSKDQVEETPVTDIEVYKQTKLDFNNDGNFDIILSISNGGTADVPQSAGSNVFILSSADSNLTFLSKNINLDDYWYEENKTVNINSTSNLSFKYFYSFLFKRNIQNGKYTSEWIIDENFSTKKIVVFQNKKGLITKCGWVRFNFNISTKKLSIEDFYETTTNTLTTGKK